MSCFYLLIEKHQQGELYMKKLTISFAGACIMMASYAHAGFNGNTNIHDNQGNGNGAGDINIGQCNDGEGQNGGKCVGESNGATKPKEKEKGDVLNSICKSPFMKKYAVICQ